MQQILTLNEQNNPGSRISLLRGIVNYIGLQVGWLACAIGAAQGTPWLGPLVVAGHLVIHFWWTTTTDRTRELYFVLIVGLLGTGVDSFKKVTGLLTYASDNSPGWLAPYWIVAMWVLFATAYSVSLRWLQGRYWLSAVLGAIFGPLSYVAGERLNGVTFNYSDIFTIIALALIWGAVLPVLAWLSKKMKIGAKLNR